MRARSVTAGLALAGALITPCSLAACGGGGKPAAAPATSKPAPLPHTLTGSVTVYLGGFVWDEGVPCVGYSEHKEITGGADVVVRDAAGKVVAQGDLQPGSTQMQVEDPTRAESCRYDFTIPNIPTGQQFYSVQIADVKPKQLTEPELSQRQDWTVD